MQKWSWILAATVLFLATGFAPAVITVLKPLKDFINEAEYIAVARVEKVYPDKPAMILTVHEDLKEKMPFRRMPALLKGSPEAIKGNHSEILLKRVAEGVPIVLFVHFNKDAGKYHCFGYTNGTWFQLLGHKGDADFVNWSFAHCEPYLRRSFKGTTEEMKQTLVDVLAGKKRAPKANEDEPPGFGPELKK